MKRAIIIHGWDQRADQEWLPWLRDELIKKGWHVDLPQMPDAKNPKLSEWMNTLVNLEPDENTVLVGHSLANALIMKYLESDTNKAKAAVLVAAWDYLMEDVRKFHQSFFEAGFNHLAIKKRKTPLVIVQSTNDPWLDFGKAQDLSQKIGASFVAMENAGHFMSRDGYSKFPKLLEIVTGL